MFFVSIAKKGPKNGLSDTPDHISASLTVSAYRG